MKARQFVYERMILFLVVLGYNSTAYWGARALSQGKIHYELGFPFEEKIPMIPWTVYIYLGCYLFWGCNYLLAIFGERREAWRFAIAELISKTVCFEIYTLFPTTMKRPVIVGNSLSEVLLKNLYLWDPADNLLPSIHCLVSWFCFIVVRRRKDIPTWYKCLSCVLAVLVCISTLTVKQHVIMDVFAGILLAEFAYWLSGKFVEVVLGGRIEKQEKEKKKLCGRNGARKSF